MKTLFSICVIFLCSQILIGQNADTQTKTNSIKANKRPFFDRFTIRKSFASANDKAESAITTYTNPKDKDESWLLNLAIGLDVLSPKKTIITLNPYFEYHRNTLVDKEQDNWQFGLASEWQINNDLLAREWSPILINSIKYNKDEEKDITSFQGNFYSTFLFRPKNIDKAKYFFIPNNITNFGKAFQWVWIPFVGFENENRIESETPSAEGYIYRFYLRATTSIVLFPKSDKWSEKIEFKTDWEYRHNFSESVEDLTKKDHVYFACGVNYIFFSKDEGKKSAKIGFDYIDGENPNKSFEDQSYYALTLKIKI